VKNLNDIVDRYSKHIEIKETKIDECYNYIIVVLDTQVWIINEFGDLINHKLLFSTSSYDYPGKSFIDFFNKHWETADKFNFKKDE
jgi:hypothetical protein